MHVTVFNKVSLVQNKANILVLDCLEGKNGSECEKPCQYPAFGGRCQSICKCSEEYCDPLMGCNGKVLFKLLSFS